MADFPYIGTPISGPADSTFENKGNKGAAGGYAPLDENAKVPTANLPDQASLDAEVDVKIAKFIKARDDVPGDQAYGPNTDKIVTFNQSVANGIDSEIGAWGFGVEKTSEGKTAYIDVDGLSITSQVNQHTSINTIIRSGGVTINSPVKTLNITADYTNNVISEAATALKINTQNNDGTSGSIDMSGGTDSEWSQAGSSGSIDLSGGDGSITEETANQNGGNGGSLLLAGEDLTGANGGTIDCRGLNGISGGSINTSGGGGSIDTRGSGSIQFGHLGTRTTLNGSASGSDKTITLPNATGTIALTNDSRFTDARTPTSHAHGNITDAGAVGTTANLPLITTTSGVVTTGSFGTTANTFCQGNDSRLSDSRTPTAHTHGNITNAGAVGSTANLPLITTTSGVVTTGTFGTTANTFCAGDDSRISGIVGNKINIGVYGGSITSDGYGGSIDTSGYGGSIFTNGYGGTLNLGNHGGSVITGPYGGAINTTGQGSIGLGTLVSAWGTGQTLILGSASGTDKTITLPNATGTIALTNDARFGSQTIFTLGGEAKTTFLNSTSYLYGCMPTRGPQVSGGYLNAVLKILGNFTITGIAIHQYLPSASTATLTYQLVRVTSTATADLLGSSIVVAGNNNLTTATSSLSVALNNGDSIGLMLQLGSSGSVPTNLNPTTILAHLYCVPR